MPGVRKVTERIAQASPALGEEEIQAVARVLRSGRLTQGPETAAFEEELARGLSGTAHAVAVSSGTVALELAYRAAGLEVGDEIVTSAFTFGATISAALRLGIRVRLADIDEDFLLDPDGVKAIMTPTTSAIVPVHLFGLPADMDALDGLGLPIIEDAAQAHLAFAGSRRAGSLGLAGCFSFYPTKNMTTGEGGAITTNDGALAETVRTLRNIGMRGRYEYVDVGTNARISEIAAAIGRVQLAKLAGFVEKRRRIASRYSAALNGVDWLRLPREPAGRTHAWNQFTVRIDQRAGRDRVSTALAEAGVASAVHYPEMLAEAAAFRHHPLVVTEDAPMARACAREVLSLPMHAGITEDNVDRIADVILQVRP